MAQNKTKLVTTNVAVSARTGKLRHVYVAEIAVTSKLELYNAADGSGTPFYQVDGTANAMHSDIDVPFNQLYAKVTGAAKYNVIFE